MVETDVINTLFNLGGIGTFAWVVYRQGEKNSDKLERMISAISDGNASLAVAVAKMSDDHREIKDGVSEVNRLVQNGYGRSRSKRS